MNRIYRIVFNRTLGVPQVVSELAGTPGGGVIGTVDAPPKPALKSRLLTAAVGLALVTAALPTWAQSCTQTSGTLTSCTGSTGTNGGAANQAGGTPLVPGSGTGGSNSEVAGSGGAFGGTGGTGGTYINASFSGGGGGGVYGAGGAGGSGGGGGGGGGAGGNPSVIATGSLTVDAGNVIQGGGGGEGAAKANGDWSYGGGGGGGAAAIDVNETIPSLANAGSIMGGKGGAGANGIASGGGGGGGMGLSLGSASNQLANTGRIQGGAGGNAGVTKGNTPEKYGGGGSGGAGLSVTGSNNTMNNAGTLAGGQGGTGSNSGAGGVGVGISGDNNTLITSGDISGGLNGNGANRANAVYIGGSNNTLELQSGASFDGNVVSESGNGNSLALGGGDDASFDVTSVGSQFTGFDSFEKNGTSTWTLTGDRDVAGPLSINAGELDLEGDGSRFSGGITMAAGTTLVLGGTDAGVTVTGVDGMSVGLTPPLFKVALLPMLAGAAGQDGSSGVSGSDFTLSVAETDRIAGGDGGNGINGWGNASGEGQTTAGDGYSGGAGGAGGAGVSGSGFNLTNLGTIAGGRGGNGAYGSQGGTGGYDAAQAGGTGGSGGGGGAGGTGVSGTQFTLNNSGLIIGGQGAKAANGNTGGGGSYSSNNTGGSGGAGGAAGTGGSGGAGVAGSYAKVTNQGSGVIAGGDASGFDRNVRGGNGGNGGNGGKNYNNGDYTSGSRGVPGAAGNAGVGGAGITGMHVEVTNDGHIGGGQGGYFSRPGESFSTTTAKVGGAGGTGGTGINGHYATVTNNATGNITGGAGGTGGYGSSSNTPDAISSAGGSGGTGGAGISGTQLQISNAGSISGGVGGLGSNGTQSYADYLALSAGGIAGDGGVGGSGVSGSSFTLTNTNTGTVTGGMGEDGADGRAGHSFGGPNGNGSDAGAGRAGGVGVSGSSFTLINSGTIVGGAGGLGGIGGAGSTHGTDAAGNAGMDGAGGGGGVGLVSTGDSIVATSGSIAGGLGADGAQADAVNFSGGNNVLELDAGFSFIGNVVSTSGMTPGGDTLALGGATDASFALNQLGAVGSAVAYQGFASYRKSGTSTWTLAGLGDAGQAWAIVDGTLAGSTSSLVGNVTFTPENGDTAVVAFDQAQRGTYAGTLSGDGTLRKTGSSALALTGTNTYSAGTALDAGTLVLGNASAIGTGILAMAEGTALDFSRSFTLGNAITLSGDPTFNVDTGLSTTLAGDISDGTQPGDLVKTGAGTLILTGTDTYTGATQVAAGTLNVLGSLASTVSVDPGAMLVGTGRVGGMAVADGATVSPGGNAVVGTLSVNGNLSMAAGSMYQLDATDTGGSDLIHVTGTATLGGSSVISTAAGSNWNASTKYTIVAADSGLVGTFGAVSNNFAFLTPTLDYDANHAFLTLARNTIRFLSVGVTPNEIDTGGAIEALGSGNAVYDAVLPLAADPARAAFNELSGDSLASTRTAIIDDSRYVRDAITNHLQGVQGANEIGQQSDAQGSVWASTWGHGGNHDSNSNASNLKSHGSGLLVGADKNLGSWRLGAVAGAGELSNRNDDAADAHSTSTVLGLYTGMDMGAWQFQGGAAHSWYQASSHRHIDVAGLGDTTTARYDNGVTQAYVDAGYRFALASGSLTPFVNLARVWLHQDAIRESGLAGLDVQANGSSVNDSTVGLRATWAPNAWTQWHASVGYQRAWGDLASVNHQRFANGGSETFSVTGVPVAKNAGIADLGIRFPLSKNVSIDASYHGQFASDAKDQSARMALNVTF